MPQQFIPYDTSNALVIDMKLEMGRFKRWARHTANEGVKRTVMRALRRTAYEVREAEMAEVRRSFPKRPSTTTFMARAMAFEQFPRTLQVVVGPIKKRKNNRTHRILADHERGAMLSRTRVKSRKVASRLISPDALAVPVSDNLRGTTGKLRFSSYRRGLNATNWSEFANPKRGTLTYRSSSGKRIVAVRTKQQHPTSVAKGPWGLSRPRGGKYPYLTNLFVLKQQAQLDRGFKFYEVAERVARAEFPKKIRREFDRAGFGGP